MGDARQARESIQTHLRELLASPEFSRAGVQARALEAMVQARRDGTHPTGSDLAGIVYGRSDDNYVRAIRQVVREIRLKLARLYSTLPDAPVRFEIPEGQYVVEVIERAPATALPPPPPAPTVALTLEPEASPSVRRAPSLRPAAMLALALLGIAAVIAWRSSSTSRASAPVLAGVRIDDQGVVPYDADRRPLPEWRELLLDLARLPNGAQPHAPWNQFLQATVLSSTGGETDTLAVLACTISNAEPCRLHAIDFATREVVRTLELPLLGDGRSRPTVLHAPTDGEFPANFDISGFDRAELDGDPATDDLVVSVQHNGLFPTEHVGVSLGRDREWKILFDYWTMGYASPVVLPDRDGDGANEILLFGARNADQVAFVTLLPPVPANLGFRGRTPEGRRPTLLDEVASYPVRGMTIALPNSPLASPDLPEFYNLRGETQRVTLTPDGRALEVVYLDGARNPHSDTTPQVIATLPLDGEDPAVRFDTYDFFLRSLLQVISAGRLPDRWAIRKTESLMGLSQEMAAEIRSYDAESGDPQWRPVDLEGLARRLRGR